MWVTSQKGKHSSTGIFSVTDSVHLYCCQKQYAVKLHYKADVNSDKKKSFCVKFQIENIQLFKNSKSQSQWTKEGVFRNLCIFKNLN